MTDFYKQKKALDELSSIYLKLDEISADTALAASKEADKKRGQLAAAGNKEGAAKKAKQAKSLYDMQARKRLNRESVSDWRKDLSDWKGNELIEDQLSEIVKVDKTSEEEQEVVKEKNVKNKIVIDPEVKLEQALGAENVKVTSEGMTTAALEQCPECGKSHDGDCVEEEVADEYLETVAKVKKAENEADKERWTVEEEILWDRVARDLTRLGEMGGTKFKVIPFNEAKVDAGKSADEKATARNLRNTPPGADKDTDLKTFITRKPGESLDKARQRVRQRKHAEKRGGSHNKSTSQGQMMSGKGTIYSNEGYQRNPEEGERKERAAAKKREAIPGQASRGMPPRGNKKREEFERWYAANVR